MRSCHGAILTDSVFFVCAFPALHSKVAKNMAKNLKVIPYVRERDFLTKDAPYATKFADFITKVAQAKATGCDCILIAEPWVIGDTYDEIIESLSHLAGTDLCLTIATARKAPWNN